VSVLSLLHSMLLHSSEGSLLFDALSFNTAILACCNAAFTVDQCCGDDEDSKAQAWHIGKTHQQDKAQHSNLTNASYACLSLFCSVLCCCVVCC
jgi:hypothetical protein